MDEELLKEIKLVIDAEKQSVNLPILPIHSIDEILKGEFGLTMELQGDEINGWDCDFLYEYHGKHKYYLMGSLWYGNYKFEVQ